MIEFTEEEKKLINEIFNNFPLHGTRHGIEKLLIQMKIILEKINNDKK